MDGIYNLSVVVDKVIGLIEKQFKYTELLEERIVALEKQVEELELRGTPGR